jgi:hypothetical protein
MDLTMVWTALGVVCLVGGGVIKMVRDQDDKRISGLEEAVRSLSDTIIVKAHKDEVTRVEARLDREISELRSTTKDGFEGINAKLDDKFDRLMDKIVTLSERK